MQPLIDFWRDHPWLWLVAAVGLAIWIGALWLIFKSPKFIRKWLWVLLSLCTFTFTQRTGPVNLSLGLPLGSLYILWFWRFGRPPTPEQLEKAAAKRQQDESRGAPNAGILALRGAYVAATLAAAMMGWFMISGGVAHIMATSLGNSADQQAFGQLMIVPNMIMFGLICGVFAFLCFRPYWWGKLLCLWAGLGWFGFGVFFSIVGSATAGSVAVAIAGLTMLATAAVHQVVDPRFAGAYPRRAA
jgi:hypothetical protein